MLPADPEEQPVGLGKRRNDVWRTFPRRGHDGVSPKGLAAPPVAAFLASLLGALTWRHGAAMTPDSWAYWQGSVSLLHGDGYRFFFGRLPVTDWPPGYSLYLELWQRLFGVSGLTLAAANVFLGGLSAFNWSWVLIRLLGRVTSDVKRPRFPLATAVVLYVTVLTAYAGTFVLADNLKYALLPWLLYASVTAAESSGVAFLGRVVAAGLIGAVLMLVHNGSVAFIAAAGAVVLCGQDGVGRRVAGAALLGVLALGPWLLVTRALGQGESHRVILGGAHYTPLYYVNELARGVGDLLAVRPIMGCVLFLVPAGLTVWGLIGGRGSAATALDSQGRRIVGLCALFAAVSVVALYAVFNLTWVQDPIDAQNGRRYLLFLPLIVVPLGLVCGSRRLPPVALLAIVLAALLLPVPRMAHDIAPAASVPSVLIGHLLPVDRIPLNGTIRPGYINRPPSRESGAIVLAPPLYPWLSREMSGKH